MRHYELVPVAAKPFAMLRHAVQAGFAYIWLLFVVALTGLGSASVLELHQSTMRREKEKQLLWIGRQYVGALESYRDSSKVEGAVPQVTGLSRPFDPRQYPATLEDLLKDPRFPGTKRHLRTIYTDPLTGKAEWGLLRREGRIVGVHSLSADRPVKQAGFESGQDDFQGAEQYSGWVFAPTLTVTPAPAAGVRTSP